MAEDGERDFFTHLLQTPQDRLTPRLLVVLRLGKFYHVADCATYGNAVELSVLPKNLHWYVSARPHSDPHHRINAFPGNHLQTEPLENHGQGDLQCLHSEVGANTRARPSAKRHVFVLRWFDG